MTIAISGILGGVAGSLNVMNNFVVAQPDYAQNLVDEFVRITPDSERTFVARGHQLMMVAKAREAWKAKPCVADIYKWAYYGRYHMTYTGWNTGLLVCIGFHDQVEI